MFTSEYKQTLNKEIYNQMVFINYLLFFFLSIAGLFLVWMTRRGKRWAKWLFIIFCGVYAIDALWANYHLSGIPDGSIESKYIVRGVISFFVWFYLIVLTLKQKKGSDSNFCNEE